MRTIRSFHHRFLTVLFSVGLYGLLSAPVQADIAVIVHPENPLHAIETSELQRIYLGRMRMFPDSSQGIETVDQPEDSARFSSFYQSLTRLTPAKLKRQRASYLFSGKGRLPIVMQDDATVKQHVASTPAAIGYVQADQVDDTVKVVATVKTE